MPTILIVDDRPLNRNYVLTLLGYGPHRLLEASGGEEALEIARRERPDLIITDLVMPGIDGFELVQRLRRDPNLSRTKVLFHTATYRLDVAKSLAVDCLVDGVIPKPCDPRTLVDHVAGCLGIGSGDVVPDVGMTRAEVENGHAATVALRLGGYLREVRTLNAKMNETIDMGLGLGAGRTELRSLAGTLSDAVEGIQSVSMRLAALLELEIDLAAQREPGLLVDSFCRAAQDILSARVAHVALLGDDGRTIVRCVDRGLGQGETGVLATGRACDGVLARALDERVAIRGTSEAASAAGWPGLRGFLVVPLATATRTYGLLWVGDKLGDEAFSEDDERLALTLAAQAAVCYENVVLYDEIQRHAASLEREVAERRKVEDALRAAEREYRGIFEGAADGIFRLAPDGRMRLANPAFASIAGYTAPGDFPSDLDFASELCADAAAGRHVLDATCRQGQVGGIELDIRRRDGSANPVRLSMRAVRDDQGAVREFEGIAEDMRDRRLLEQRLAQSQRLEAFGQLAGGVAHDFNNLLMAIGGYTELAMNTLDPEHPARPDLDIVRETTRRAGTITSQLLQFSRCRMIETAVLDLNEVVTGLQGVLGRLLGEDIRVEMALDPALGRVRGDCSQFEQVVLNLLINARDAMPNGGRVRVETRNQEVDAKYAERHVGLAPGDYVALTVTDDGEGMTPEVLSRLFEPYFTTKGQGRGTGLGLSTVYGIVAQAGGAVWAESEPGLGSAFHVLLPGVVPSGEEASPSPASKEFPTGGETILLVEDDELVRNVSVRMLRQAGYVVLVASHPHEGLKIARSHSGHIDLLLTDVVMPDMNGRQLSEQIVAARPLTHLLYMSGYTDDAVLRTGLLQSRTAMLAKPFARGELLEKVRSVLDSSSSPPAP